MTKIAVAGFHHETNTFAAHPATLDIFIDADNWPGLTRGADMFKVFDKGNAPMVGFLSAFSPNDIVPLTWANAEPSGKVTEEAFETIAQYIVDDLKKALPIDALYLDLHGAMVTAHLPDGEGELLKRIRKIVGDELLIVVSHDLHANVSPETFALSDIIISYRTYPHIDMAETGLRVAKQLQHYLHTKTKPKKAYRALDFLIPLTAQCSFTEPCASIYQHLADIEKAEQCCLSFNTCFPLADADYTAPTILAYGDDEAAVNAAADQLQQVILDKQQQFEMPLYSEEDAIAYYQSHYQPGETVIFADTQDNPGAGGVCNTMGIFASLVKHHIPNAIVAVVWDAVAAQLANQHDIGDTINLSLGDKFQGEFCIEAHSDGRFIGTGDFYKDLSIDLGPMAVLNHQGVHVIVSSKKMQAADQAIFTHLGLNPRDYSLLILKSSVHFRADFTKLAGNILVVESPGANIADLNKLTYKHCRRPIL